VSRVVLWTMALLLLVVVLGFIFLPAYVDRQRNPVSSTALPAVSESAKALHDSLFVADMHADQLLWARDPLARSARGHVDVPRLADGNVALQVFSVVTKTPRGLNFDRNTGETDNITLLAIAQRWPVASWTSLTARALHQSARLHDAERRSNGELSIVRSREDLTRFLEARKAKRSRVAGVLAIEGLQALDGKLENVDTLFRAGFRMMGLTHFFDNEVAGSAHGVSHGGLTPLGRDVIARMEALGIIVDLAHASPRTIEETLALSTRPVVVSHTGGDARALHAAGSRVAHGRGSDVPRATQPHRRPASRDRRKRWARRHRILRGCRVRPRCAIHRARDHARGAYRGRGTCRAGLRLRWRRARALGYARSRAHHGGAAEGRNAACRHRRRDGWQPARIPHAEPSGNESMNRAWWLLTLAGVLEVVWAIGLKYSDGFRKQGIAAITVAAMIASFYYLAQALKTLPVGTGYAVWTGIGAVGTAIVGMVVFGESKEVGRLVSIGLIVAGIVGLKVTAGSGG
jgi:membrane dipeptidase